MAHVASVVTQSTQDAGFQLYTRVPITTMAIVPDKVSYADASVLPLCFDTAVVGLFSEKRAGGLGLSPPSLDPKPSGKAVLVWGGSSAVGASVIQLAVAAGAKVIATASRHNFDFCKECGASQVFDHRSKSIVDDLSEAIRLVGGEFAGVFDAVSLQDQTMKPCFEVLEKLGLGDMVVLLPPPDSKPPGLNVTHIVGWSEKTHGFWKSYMTQALESGSLKCLPRPLIVGKGLEAVQAGLDKIKVGLSAQKLVIEL